MLRSGFQVLDRKLGVDVSLQMSDSKTSNWSTPTHMCNTDPSVLSQLESRDTLRLRTVLPFLMPWIPSWCSDKILVSMKEQQTNMLELSIWPGALEGHVKTGNQKKIRYITWKKRTNQDPVFPSIWPSYQVSLPYRRIPAPILSILSTVHARNPLSQKYSLIE